MCFSLVVFFLVYTLCISLVFDAADVPLLVKPVVDVQVLV